MADTAGVTITWLGHAAFLLEAGDTRVLVDPFLTGNPTATVTAEEVDPTVILITHAHNDHVGDALAISKRTGAKIIATNELGVYLGKQGADAVGANIGGTVAFEGGTVKFVAAVHTSAFDDGTEFVAPGAAAGLVVRLAGKTVYLAGDTALFGDMALIGTEGLDVAIVPIGGHYTMDPSDAVLAVGLLHPVVAIPCHFNTFPMIEQDADVFATNVSAGTDAVPVVLVPGESHIV
ncbi:MAG: beta-lactamase domain protein [Glaciihabitans sp.]|nr:beta-lactamase domain protein [Glaciihabitans sp.]